MKHIYILLLVPLIYISSYAQNPCPGIPTVDYAGKTYHTIQIGSQCWLKENLDVGTRINGSLDQTNNGIIEKYCYNDDTANCTTYGGLYQWAEAIQYQNGATDTSSPSPAFSGNIQGVCPAGWHIPTGTEFDTLAKVVGNNSNALKAIGQGTGIGTGTNISGFSALLSGNRYNNGYFYSLGYNTYFWSSMEYDTMIAWNLNLYCSDSIIHLLSNYKVGGFSVRCLKDGATGINDHSNNTLPKSFDLSQNFPNPFNPNTTICFTLPEKSRVVLSIFNEIGQKVAELFNGEKAAGSHSVEWNASKFVSGIYYYELKTEKFTSVKKLVLMK